jgi:hypothetical protein
MYEMRTETTRFLRLQRGCTDIGIPLFDWRHRVVLLARDSMPESNLE